MTGGIGSDLYFSPRLTRALKVAAIVLGVGLVFGAGPLHAQDEDADETKTFEEKLMDNLMSGLGGKKLEDGSIDYRERSPLVVPSKIDLPPPETGKPKFAPNWPKDPDEKRRGPSVVLERRRRDLNPREVLSSTRLAGGRTRPLCDASVPVIEATGAASDARASTGYRHLRARPNRGDSD